MSPIGRTSADPVPVCRGTRFLCPLARHGSASCQNKGEIAMNQIQTTRVANDGAAILINAGAILGSASGAILLVGGIA